MPQTPVVLTPGKPTGQDPITVREPTPGTAVAPMFIRRLSPRAMSGAPLEETALRTLLEAARWAPSCFNAQPWAFAWVTPDSDQWQPVFDSLVEGNQRWAKNAAALIGVASRTCYEHNDKPAPTHAFDAGAAWMSMALQASEMGLVAHGMLGFDPDATRDALAVPEPFHLNAIIAVGHPGRVEDLPEDHQEREQPSARKSLDEIAFEGGFGGLVS